jgi:hypothetical protein
MIEFISEKFSSIAIKCLERNAKEFKVGKKEVQLIFKLNTSNEVDYLIAKQYEPQKVLSFLEVLGVKLDFKGYSLFVPKFIKGALTRFCDEHKIEKSKVGVLISCSDKDELIMWLYGGNKAIKQVTLESLFDTEDILEN